MKLEDLLVEFKNSKLTLYLEIKDMSEECSREVVKLVSNIKSSTKYVFISFDHRIRAYLEKYTK